MPTHDQKAELTRLVRLCGDAYHFTPAEHDEALQIALADPVSALICFRAIAREVPANSGHTPALMATTHERKST